MKNFLQRGCFYVLLIAVAVSVITSLPTWWDGHLGGYALLAHMTASGVIVIALPLYAVLRWTDWFTTIPQRAGEPIAFWIIVVFGFLTIASMFACMTPITSTSTMRELIDLHGWLGSVMAIAVVANLFLYRKRRKATS